MLKLWWGIVKTLLKSFRKNRTNRVAVTVANMFNHYPPSVVRDILEKRARSKKKPAIERLAYYYIRCGEIYRARKILGTYRLETSSIYIKAVIHSGGDLVQEINRQLEFKGKISHKIARLISKSVQNAEEKNKLKSAILKAPSIEQEKSLWRLIVIGQAARCVGDHEDALKAYRRAFQCARSQYTDLVTKVPLPTQKTANQNEDFNLKNAWQALNDFSALAVPGWFIDAGTLLGFIREGNFLKHDYDLDLGVHNKTSFMEIKKRLHYSPLFEIKPVRVDEVMKVRHFNGMDIDIFLYLQEHNKMYKKSHVYRWDFDCFTVELKNFGEHKLPVPSKPERHLEATYGDWWVKRKEFDGRYDALNISFPNIDEFECVLLNKSIAALRRGDGVSYDKETKMLKKIGRYPSD